MRNLEVPHPILSKSTSLRRSHSQDAVHEFCPSFSEFPVSVLAVIIFFVGGPIAFGFHFCPITVLHIPRRVHLIVLRRCVHTHRQPVWQNLTHYPFSSSFCIMTHALFPLDHPAFVMAIWFERSSVHDHPSNHLSRKLLLLGFSLDCDTFALTYETQKTTKHGVQGLKFGQYTQQKESNFAKIRNFGRLIHVQEILHSNSHPATFLLSPHRIPHTPI